MTVRLHANNFSTTLNGSILIGATTAVLTSVTGLPSLAAGQFYNLTFTNGSTIEIVKVTALSSFTVTIARAQEGTSASAWANGTVVALRETADSFDRKPDTPTSPVAYAVACWGTTVAGQMQTVASVGTTGQVLTSNGASALPTMQSPKPLDVVVQSTGITCAANTAYICTQASLQTMTLSAGPTVGDVVELHGTTTSYWKLAANGGQTIKYLGTTTSSGGSLTCTSQYDCIRVMYIATNIWSVVFASIGSAITVA
jgi:hypothetical protein